MASPSSRISADYLEEQQRLHDNPRYGVASLAYGPLVASLIRIGGCRSVADYGAGKRNLKRRLDELGRSDIAYHPYDPAFPEYGAPRPADLVCCIDVLEHVEPDHLDAVLDDLAAITTRLGFFTVHTGAARKLLSDGRNAHIIQNPPGWWLQRLIERFEIIHVQSVPKGFWVLVTPRASFSDVVASLDLQALASAAARAAPRRQSTIHRLFKGFARLINGRRR